MWRSNRCLGKNYDIWVSKPMIKHEFEQQFISWGMTVRTNVWSPISDFCLYIYIYNICIWYAEIVIWAEHMFELICLPLTIYAETLLWANIYYIFNYILNLYITQGIYNIVVKQEFEQIYVFRGIIVEFMSGAQTQLYTLKLQFEQSQSFKSFKCFDDDPGIQT